MIVMQTSSRQKHFLVSFSFSYFPYYPLIYNFTFIKLLYIGHIQNQIVNFVIAGQIETSSGEKLDGGVPQKSGGKSHKNHIFSQHCNVARLFSFLNAYFFFPVLNKRLPFNDDVEEEEEEIGDFDDDWRSVTLIPGTDSVPVPGGFKDASKRWDINNKWECGTSPIR